MKVAFHFEIRNIVNLHSLLNVLDLSECSCVLSNYMILANHAF